MRGKQLAYPKSYDDADMIMDLSFYKNFKDRSHVLAHIECLLIGTKMDEPMTLLCDKVMANMKEVWAYRVLTGRLEPVYKEDPVK
ncbi:hypothetical protein FXO37_26623 [Capsicum annuum]|nr:hypothetical protein FXO37_26623 [Capsicum annuum]